jgi:TonB-linked SusC/RagA family outer membrane protein
MLSGFTPGLSQNAPPKKRVTGRITDIKGEPLVAVNVLEVGTQNGAISDADGLYEINVSPGAQLNFTYLGFKPQTVAIGSASLYDVVLEEDVNELEELVVTGYGEQRKISSIGAQSTIKVADIKAPTGSLSTVLAGKLAGIVAVQRTGEPGKSEADIWIRGISTPNSAKPLILVDGVERPFDSLDPEDIESFTILKDASATAVYGVRGANGVMIIKTKGGIIGKPTVNVDYYEGFNRFTQLPQMADGITFMEAANEAAYNMGRGEYSVYSKDYVENTRAGVDPLLYPNVNWRKEIFKDWASTRRANVNIRGGSPMTQFYASVSYFNEKGLIKTDPLENYDSSIDYNRFNITTNLNIQLTSSTKVDIGAQGYMATGNYPWLGSATIFSSSMEVNPVKYPVMFVIDGEQYVPGTHTQGAERNPYADATKRGYRIGADNRIQSNVRVVQDLDFLLKGLKFNAMFAFDANFQRERRYTKRENTFFFADRSNPYDAEGNPILTTTWNGGSSVLNWDGRDYTGELKDYFESSFVYDKKIGADHRIGAMVIYTQENKTYNQADNIIASIPFRVQGLAGRATYSWRDKYFAEFNIGYNGGENFPKDRRFGIFPAYGAGWVASNENFWEPFKEAVPFFKIRYTYGKVGNSGVDNSSDVNSRRRFMYLEQYTADGDWGYVFGTNGRSGYRISNPMTSLGWEIATKQDLGLDLQLLKGDLSLTVDLFKEHRTDILMERTSSLPLYAGFQVTPQGNVGESKNTGIDGYLEYNKQLNSDLGIQVRGNFTWAKPEWVDDDIPERAEWWRNRKGFSLTSIEGYHAIGLYTQTDIDLINAWLALPESEQASIPQPYPTPPKSGLGDVRAGDIMYKDMNGDGKIDDTDRSWLGNGDVPEINYGFGFNINYKALSFGLMFQGTAKANRLIGGFTKPFNDSGSGAVFSNITDRWSESNPDQTAFYPRLAYQSDALGNQNNFENSTWWLKDMSFLRLKTLQISYRLPSAWLQKRLIKNASIYVMGLNLFTLSKWKLWDPELNTNTGTSYPNTTTYTIGINFTF